MTPRTTKIFAVGLTSCAVALAAFPQEREGPSSTSAPELRERGRAVFNKSSNAPEAARRPAKARGRLRDESLATRLRGDAVVTVGGQVKRPGLTHIKEGTTILAAIERAGGVTEFGSLRRVRVVRDSGERIIDVASDDGAKVLAEAYDTIVVDQKMIIGR